MGNGVSYEINYTEEESQNVPETLQNEQQNKQQNTEELLREKCTLLIKECQTMSAEIEIAKKRMQERHTSEIISLKVKIDALEEENAELSIKHERCVQKLNGEVVATKLLRAENENKSNTIDSLQTQLQKKEEDFLSVRDELGECVMNIEEMRDENYTTEKELTEKHDKYVKSVKQIIHTLNDKMSDLQQKCDEHEQKINSDAEIMASMSKEIMKMREDMESKKIEKAALVEEYNEAINEVDITKENLDEKSRLLQREREKTIVFKKLNVALKHELKEVSKLCQKKRKHAIQQFIFSKLKVMRDEKFQDNCLQELMDETWIPNNLEKWFYEDIFAHIMMNVHNILVDE